MKKYSCVFTVLALGFSGTAAMAASISLASALINSSAAGVVDPTAAGTLGPGPGFVAPIKKGPPPANSR